MPRRARTLTWNGKDVPPELRELPAGRYFVEAVEEEAPELSADEGRVLDAERAREII